MTRESDGALRVGRYALYDIIGSGAMAHVHLGRMGGDAGFSSTVAIKRLRAELVRDPDFVARFLDEARLSARVRHPNVVQTLDVVSEGGELFVVMEYVRGESLARLADAARQQGAPIRPELAATIVGDVLRGLHAAHEATGDDGAPLEIVHRDVSPQNIVVGTDGTTRVLDFGVAKAAVRVAATRDGRVRGKLAYMAPEQLRGKATRASDIYAASIVLWELLSDERLFSGARDTDVIEAALFADIPRPSAARREQGSLASTAVSALDDVVMRGLAREPRDRFATAREMAVALEQAVAPVPREEVAAWVAGLAAEGLRDRARLVERVEALADAPTQVNVRATPERPRPPMRGLRIGRTAAIVAVGAIAALVYALARRDGSAPSAGGDEALPSNDRPLAAASAEGDREGERGGATVDLAARRPDLAPVRARPRTMTAPRSASPARKASPCDPPFSLDDGGRKLYKENCLR
jgi:eukaryotic-like serine/threonine-protein kinase